MSEMIERVAKAIDKTSQERGHRIPATAMRHLAVAAIEAMREPTDAMINAPSGEEYYETIWKEMIDAALDKVDA